MRFSAKECKCLTEIPESIGNCTLLVELNLTKCFGLLSLPDSVCRLQNLEDLCLSKTALSVLPKDIGDLHSLAHVDLSNCDRLESLPISLQKCSSLYRLDCTGCKKLCNIPEGISSIPTLKELIFSEEKAQ